MTMDEAKRHHGGPDAFGIPEHDFSTNSNACGPCPAALAAVRGADASRYPDPDYHHLRQSLAAFHQVEPDRIVLAGSASEFIFRISAWVVRFRSVTQPAKVCLPAHHYGDYADAAQTWGLQRVNDWEQAHLIWACEPSSPLGQSQPGLAKSATQFRADQTLVLDRAYEPLRLQGLCSLDASQLDAVWQLWTPNKALGLTGVRAAYAIAPRHAEALGSQMQALAPSWVIGTHGVALLQSWTTPSVQAWLRASLDILRVWKQRQIDLCETLGWQVLPSEANYFLARPDSMDLPNDLSALRTKGIKCRDATSFGLPGWVRLGVLGPGSQDALALAWKHI